MSPRSSQMKLWPVEALAVLGADPVGGDHGHDVRHRMADHRAAPQAAGVEIGIVRLGADRGREEQDLRALQHQAARRLGIPLVPAHGRADRAERSSKGLEAGIAGPEVELFRIAGPSGMWLLR
jgi:hypothetical protein